MDPGRPFDPRPGAQTLEDPGGLVGQRGRALRESDRMHWGCFNFEFEYDPFDADEAFRDLGCPKRPRSN